MGGCGLRLMWKRCVGRRWYRKHPAATATVLTLTLLLLVAWLTDVGALCFNIGRPWDTSSGIVITTTCDIPPSESLFVFVNRQSLIEWLTDRGASGDAIRCRRVNDRTWVAPVRPGLIRCVFVEWPGRMIMQYGVHAPLYPFTTLRLGPIDGQCSGATVVGHIEGLTADELSRVRVLVSKISPELGEGGVFAGRVRGLQYEAPCLPEGHYSVMLVKGPGVVVVGVTRKLIVVDQDSGTIEGPPVCPANR